MTPLTA